MVILCEMNTGQLIRDALEKRKMSQVDLAYKINVTPAQVSRIISGERGASIETLLLIADALSIERDVILKVASGLSINKGKSEDEWVDEQSHKLSLLTPNKRSMAEKLLNALLEEDKPLIPVGRKARAKT